MSNKELNELFRPYIYADILWMEDFAIQGKPSRSQGKNPYIGSKVIKPSFSEICNQGFREDTKESVSLNEAKRREMFTVEDIKSFMPDEYCFRLHPCKSVMETIEEIKKNFPRYSCAILDVDMTNDFKQDEYDDIKIELEKYSVVIPETTNFWRNAGFYIYLYLVHLGMPADRIAILTGNDTSTQKEEFRSHGIAPPYEIQKGTTTAKTTTNNNARGGKEQIFRHREYKEAKEHITAWFEKTLDAPHRLRSCMVIMSSYLLDALGKLEKEKEEYKVKYVGEAFCEKESGQNQKTEQQPEEGKQSKQYKVRDDFFEIAKMMLQSFQNMSLRLPEDTADFFKPWIWQAAQPWEMTAKIKPYWLNNIIYRAYWKTMITTRNWLAHNVLESGIKNLTTVAFLFGIGMRGMFNLHVLLDGKIKEYEAWEDELLSIIRENFMPAGALSSNSFESETKFQELTLCSFYELHTRKTRWKKSKLDSGDITRDIGTLIHEIGIKTNGYDCYEEDLIRDFLHGIAYIYFRLDKNNFESQDKGYSANIKKGRLRFEAQIDINCRNQYNAYLRGENSLSDYDGKSADINTNREWDYVEAILGIIERALDQLNRDKDVAKELNK